MTSKEALNQLYIMADTPELAMDIQSYYDIVEKDLELLEIIKNHIVTKNFEYGSDFDNYNKISFTAEIMQLKDFTDKSNGLHYTTFKVDNGFEKVKEWLAEESGKKKEWLVNDC